MLPEHIGLNPPDLTFYFHFFRCISSASIMSSSTSLSSLISATSARFMPELIYLLTYSYVHVEPPCYGDAQGPLNLAVVWRFCKLVEVGVAFDTHFVNLCIPELW